MEQLVLGPSRGAYRGPGRWTEHNFGSMFQKGSLLNNCSIGLLLGLLVLSLPAYVLLDYLRVLRLRQKLPPGPFPWPLVGNHYQIRLPRPWIYMSDLADKYKSPMITIWHGHRPNVICHDAWTITDLLDKKAHIYSSRPHMVMLGDARGATHADQVCLPYGDQWRFHRKMMHNAVGSQALRAYRPYQESEIKVLLRDLLADPAVFFKAIERYSISIVSYIGFGRRVSRMDDNTAKVALKFMEGVDLVMPGMFPMETVPILLKMPRWIYPPARIFLENFEKFTRFFSSLSNEAASTNRPSFAKMLAKERKAGTLTDKEISFMTGNLIGGGVDTTASTTISFILAMCAFPDVQARAQAVIDEAVGSERMPDWSDEPSFQYIRACVDETLRWRTVTILGGIPHAPNQDDIYRGYHIPQGTWITGNNWSIHRNPNEFPEPDEFRPERFIKAEAPYPNKKGHNAFGWGRRVCSGQQLAEQGLLLSFARLLWAFNIKPGLDDAVGCTSPEDKQIVRADCDILRVEKFLSTFSRTVSQRTCARSPSRYASFQGVRNIERWCKKRLQKPPISCDNSRARPKLRWSRSRHFEPR
jgi:cytochrome P450